MSSKFKGTPLPWVVRKGNGLLFVESEKETVDKAYGQEILADDYWDESWKEHDAELIAETAKVLHETGKTPAQLAQQIKDLKNSIQIAYEDLLNRQYKSAKLTLSAAKTIDNV